MIPLQLQKEQFRFVLLKPKQKIPFEKDWQNTANYRHNDKKLLEHIKKGSNYGVLGGCGGLLIIDFDDKTFQEKFAQLLPKTLTTQTGSRGVHKYFICDDPKSFKILDKKKNTLADVQGKSKQVVGAGSVHPNGKRYIVVDDFPIAEIKLKNLQILFNEFLKDKEKHKPVYPKDDIVDQIKRKVSLKQILDHYGYDTSKNPTMCKLGHSSKGGSCFSFNDDLFNCFHCGEAGDIFNLVMDQENCDFIQAKKKLMGISGIEETVVEVSPVKLDLQYKTEHLSYFGVLNKASNLYGKEYLPLLKARWYQFVGMVLREKKINYKGFRVDTRVHLLCSLKSGRGKKNLKIIGKKVLEKLNYKVEEPTSLHPEQLVGKVVEKGKGKNKEYVANRGYFDSDLLQFDEALELLTSKDLNIREARAYICIATDPIGDNTISKKLVEHTSNQKLSYDPKVSLMLFFQPLPIPSEAVTSGFMRRFLSLYVKSKTNTEDVFTSRLDKKINDMDHLCSLFKDYLSDIKKNTEDFEFEDSCDKVFLEYALALVDIGQSHSKKGYQFTEILEQTLLDLLVKFSCIITGSFNHKTVTPNHIKIAFMDLTELFISSLDFVNDKVYGELDYGTKWKTADERKIKCLEWLFDHEAVSLEKSNTTIDNFVDRVAEIFGVMKTQARNKYLSMVKNNLICSKQIGKTDSRVWLAEKPKEDVKGYKGYKGYTLYKGVTSEIKNLMRALKPLKPLKPLTEKVAENSIIVDEENIEDNKITNYDGLIQYVKDNPKIRTQQIIDNCSPEFPVDQALEKAKERGDLVNLDGNRDLWAVL
ncbi:MAG: bifunctional DNA primase/polymerase [Nanoarchaeota archaeon]